VVITVLLLPSMMTTISSSTEAEHLPHVWKDYKYSGLWSVAAKANDDDEMDESDTWDELRDFFSGCSTIDDFYDAIVDDIGQANNGIQSMVGLSNDLSDIVDAALEAKGEGDPDGHKLLCHQHAMLFAAGVKAMNSQWDESREKYVMWSTSDFNFIFWVGEDGANHVQLVIDQWKDDGTPKGASYWEVDTWNGENEEWDPDDGLYKNSKMWTE